MIPRWRCKCTYIKSGRTFLLLFRAIIKISSRSCAIKILARRMLVLWILPLVFQPYLLISSEERSEACAGFLCNRMVSQISSGKAVEQYCEVSRGILPKKIAADLSRTYIAVKRRRSDCFFVWRSCRDESGMAWSRKEHAKDTVSEWSLQKVASEWSH